MTFLPIVRRELRARARRPAIYWIRAVAATSAAAITTLFLLLNGLTGWRNLGGALFQILGWIGFLFCLGEGLRQSADSISREKREGTLGLLFLTDLRGYDVILGKVTALGISSAVGLVAMLPLLGFPLLLGGVTAQAFWRLSVTLVCTLMFSLSAGMFVSTFTRGERQAWTCTLGLLVIWIVGLPLLDFACGFGKPVFARASPLAIFWGVLRQTPWRTANFWQDTAVLLSIAASWLVIASLVLGYGWRRGDRPLTERKVSPKRRQARHRRRAHLLEANPVAWLSLRKSAPRYWAWGLVVGTGLCVGLSVAELNAGGLTRLWQNPVLYLGIVFVHVSLILWVTWQACFALAEARWSGALELILVTPLTTRELVNGQYSALRQIFFGPVLCLLLAETALLILTAFDVGARSVVAGSTLFGVIGGLMVAFVLELFTLSRVALWFALTTGRPTQAFTRTLLLVVVLPLLPFPCYGAFAPVVLVAKDIGFLVWADNNLRRRFRQAAAQPLRG